MELEVQDVVEIVLLRCPFPLRFLRVADPMSYELFTRISVSPLESQGIFDLFLPSSLQQGTTPWMQLIVQRRGLRSMADMILGRWDHAPAWL